MYTLNSMGEFFGSIPNDSFMQVSQNIDGFRRNNLQNF